MTTGTVDRMGWISPIVAMLDVHGWRGCYLAAIQSYRPDVVRMIASELGLTFCDVREEHMAPLGRQAASLPLAGLNELAVEAGADGGVVLHNVEALLAAREESERTAWLSEFVRINTAKPVLVPLSVFFNEAPGDCPRVAWIPPTDLPEEKLLTRLALR